MCEFGNFAMVYPRFTRPLIFVIFLLGLSSCNHLWQCRQVLIASLHFTGVLCDISSRDLLIWQATNESLVSELDREDGEIVATEDISVLE